MQDDGLYTLYWAGATALERPAAASTSIAAAGAAGAVTLAAATEVNWLIIEPSDLIEVGVVPTVAGAANPFTVTVTKAQTTAAASDLGTSLATLTTAALSVTRVLRGYKDAYPLVGAETHPTNRPSNTIPYVASTGIPGYVASTPHDLWHFDRGDVLVFLVSDTAAAGALGIFYARFQRTGSARTNRKWLVNPGAAAAEFTVDLDSTT